MINLNWLDIFGTTFKFTTFKNSKFHTSFGKFLSFATYLLVGSFIGVFGVDLFNRSNPKVISEKIKPLEYTNFTVNPKNFTFAWTIEDDYGYFNFSKKLFPKIRYRQTIRNNKTGTLEKVREDVLGSTPCNDKTVKDQKFLDQFNPHHWNCFDFEGDNMTMGGFWDGKFMSYIYLYLYYCPDNDQNSPDCLNLEELKSLMMTQSLYFSIIYPEFYFEPGNLENPLRYQYKTSYNQISINIIKKERVFFQPVHADDDQNLLVTKFTKFSQLAFSRFKNDFSFKNDIDYQDKTKSTMLYALVLYFDKDGDKFTRTFMKLQDLAATVGGFMQLIFVAGKILCAYYNSYQRNITLINELFEFNEKSKVIPEKKVSDSKTQIPFVTTKADGDKDDNILRLNHKISKKAEMIIINNNENIEKEKAESEESKSNKSHEKSDVKKFSTKLTTTSIKPLGTKNLSKYTINIGKDELMGYKSMKERKTFGDLNFLSSVQETSIKKKIVEGETQRKEEKEEFGLGLFLFLKKTLCRKFLNSEEKEKVEIYEFALEYVKSKLDITSYMSYLETVDKLKLLNYNEIQNYTIKNLKKPNLLNKEERELYELEVTEVDSEEDAGEKKLQLVKYFIKKLKEDSFEDTDKKLFDMLDSKLKVIILNEACNM